MQDATNQIMCPPETGALTVFLKRRDCFMQLAELAAATTADQPLSVIWIALDRFKRVNESLGHTGGDAFISRITQRLRNKMTADVYWYRMAGDEFACLVPDSDSHRISQLAAALLLEIEIPLAMGDLLLHPSASLGIATLAPNEPPNTVLERADRAMNAAKRAGGGCIVTSGSEPAAGRMGVHLARHELEIENKLHTALNQSGLSLHYQPCVDSQGHNVSVEALMRCADPKLTPDLFIPIAEKTGLIIRLGEWALLEGARFAHRLDTSGQTMPVAINVSRAQLSTPRFAKTLHAALMCANVRPELIELELTESLFMDHSRTIQDNLRAAREVGVKLAIDDFGTGYSCLATLKDISADKLKLDRAFVIALPHDRRAFAVVRAITLLGAELGMQVVAEGVENQAQLDALHEAGVCLTQGYWHARPMPETALLGWFDKKVGTT